MSSSKSKSGRKGSPKVEHRVQDAFYGLKENYPRVPSEAELLLIIKKIKTNIKTLEKKRKQGANDVRKKLMNEKRDNDVGALADLTDEKDYAIYLLKKRLESVESDLKFLKDYGEKEIQSLFKKEQTMTGKEVKRKDVLTEVNEIMGLKPKKEVKVFPKKEGKEEEEEEGKKEVTPRDIKIYADDIVKAIKGKKLSEINEIKTVVGDLLKHFGVKGDDIIEVLTQMSESPDISESIMGELEEAFLK